MPSKLERVRINIRSVINTKGIKEETRNGRKVIIVPSATLPDDVIMNRIKYPGDEIGKSFKSLERTPAPHGHPRANGKYISARDPEGLNIGYIGAWNENVTRDKGRVFMDKIVDVEVANRTQDGRNVLAAIAQGDPIHTSTGLLCDLEKADDPEYDYIARNMAFDHDAILLNEEGAATPEQGVGMMVNGEEIRVINSSAEEAMRDLDWAVRSAVRALEDQAKAGLYEQIKQAVIAAFTSKAQPANNQTETNEMDDKAMNERFDKLETALGKIGEAVANSVTAAMKPVVDGFAAMQANAKAVEDRELEELREKIVKANLLDADGAKELTLNAARALAKSIKTNKAAPFVNGNGAGDKDEWSGYDLNSHFGDGKDKAAN